jgi:hypothetical protein
MFAVAVLVLTAVPLFSEEAPEESLAMVYRLTAKSSSVIEFEKAFKEHFGLHAAANDTWRRDVWQVVLGKGYGDYIIRSGNHTWADLDNEVEVPNDQEHVVKEIVPHLASTSTMITKLMPHLSRWPADPTPPKMVEVTIFTLHYNGIEPFFGAAKKLHTMIGEKDMPHQYSWAEVAVGASGPQFILAFPRSGWADFAPKSPDLWKMAAEFYGREEAQSMRETMGEAIAGEESFVVSYRPDLSYIPSE